jgi:hypothetical protein
MGGGAWWYEGFGGKREVLCQVLEKYSFQVLKAVEWDKDKNHHLVQTLKGKQGLVKKSEFKSCGDYRAMFKKVKGEWKMWAFIAGD